MSEQSEELYQKSIRALSRREYSLKELTSFLTRQCTNRAVVSSLIDRLQNTGYLSDERFVESVCRSYSKRYGVVYIKKFLESHDISSETINQYLPPIAEEEVHVARHLLEKKNRQTNMTLQKKKAFLERKGFSWKTIEEVTRTTA